MRTTVTLPEELYQTVRQRAFHEHRSVGEVLAELAARGLQAEADARPARPLGRYAGMITVADDFDATPAEVLDALDTPLG